MSNYEEVVKKIRKQIQFPENQLRGITESTGLRILDALYILIAMLDGSNQEVQLTYMLNKS